VRADPDKIALDYIGNLPGCCDAPGDKYEQAIQGLFTAGTSGFRVLREADEGVEKKRSAANEGLKDQIDAVIPKQYVWARSHARW
jgi:hypothetical protein